MKLVIYVAIIFFVHVVAGEEFSKPVWNSTFLGRTLQDNRSARLKREFPRYTQPFMVAIVERFRKEIFCGGAIISPTRVVTAAHCFKGQEKEDFYVVAGVVYLDKAVDDNPNAREIESVSIHPNYRVRNHINLNDIAFIEVNSPFSFRYPDKISSISVASANVYGGVGCTTIGWGIINTNLDQPNPLKEFEVEVVNGETCAENIKNDQAKDGNDVSFFRNEVHNAICVTPSGETRFKPCQGDSGGPLICNDELHGVLSFGSITCNGNSFPTVFARITSYSHWLGV